MPYILKYGEQVEFDIKEAIIWYQEQQKRISKTFLAELKNHFKMIEKRPMAFAIRYDEIRCLPLKKFPFMIHYRIIAQINTIYIEAILHTSLKPHY